MQVVEQLCGEFEREVGQMTQDIVRYRGELARCADLLAFQLGKEKQYHNMLASRRQCLWGAGPRLGEHRGEQFHAGGQGRGGGAEAHGE